MSRKIIDVVNDIVEPIVQELDLEVIDIEFKKEGPDWFLRIFIDSETGVDLEDCGQVSEQLSTELDKLDPIEQAYFLEVSSAGAERPLKNEKEIIKAIGKNVYVTTYEQIDGEKTFEGILEDFDDNQLTINVKIKTRTQAILIPYDKVAKARLAIIF